MQNMQWKCWSSEERPLWPLLKPTWQQHRSPIWSGIQNVCSHSIIKSHLTKGYISAYGRKSSKFYKYVAHLELPSVPISFLDHSKNVTIVWEKSTYLVNATNMYKLQRCIRLPWIACGTIQRQTSRHECSGSHYTIWDWRKSANNGAWKMQVIRTHNG